MVCSSRFCLFSSLLTPHRLKKPLWRLKPSIKSPSWPLAAVVMSHRVAVSHLAPSVAIGRELSSPPVVIPAVILVSIPAVDQWFTVGDCSVTIDRLFGRVTTVDGMVGKDI